MNELLQRMGRPITDAVVHTVEQDESIYGDPSALLMHKRRMLQTVLEIAGLLKTDAKVEPQHVVMIEASFATVGLSNAARPDSALVRFIATGVAGAPVAGLHAYKKHEVEERNSPPPKIAHQSQADQTEETEPAPAEELQS